MPKKFNVDITAAAEADVAEIWEYIAQDDPDAATAFVLRLEEPTKYEQSSATLVRNEYFAKRMTEGYLSNAAKYAEIAEGWHSLEEGGWVIALMCPEQRKRHVS